MFLLVLFCFLEGDSKLIMKLINHRLEAFTVAP